MAAAQMPAGVSGKPGRSMAEAARMAAPRPRAAMFGTCERPGAARLGPALGAGLGDVAEGVGALVAEGGGVGRAAAADRVHDEEEGAGHQAMRPRIERAPRRAASSAMR